MHSARWILPACAVLLGVLGAPAGVWAGVPAGAAAGAGARSAAAAPKGDFAREALIDGSPEDVWRLLTTAGGIESWLAPQADVDLRVGGAIRTHQDRNGRIGDPQTLVNRVVALAPRRMLTVHVDRAPEAYPWAAAVVGTEYDVYVDPAGRGKTRVRCVGRGFPGGPMGYALRSLFDQGMGLALVQLARAAEKPKPRRL